MTNNYSPRCWRLLMLMSLLAVISFDTQLLAQNEIPAFNLSMTVSSREGTETRHKQLEFKTVEGATIGRDDFDDIYPLAPVDPNAFFPHIKPAPGSDYVGFFLTDARPLAYETTWEFAVNLPQGATGTLEWDTNQLQEGWTVTLTKNGQKTNMLTQAMLQLASAGTHNFNLTAEMKGVRTIKAGEFVGIKSGWNLLSPTVIDEPPPEEDTVSQKKAFGLLQGSLQIASEYVLGRAYWIFSETDIEQIKVPVVEYEGRPLLARQPGWNFIGVVDDELLVQGGIAWQWSASTEKPGFECTEGGELQAGLGYWIYLPEEDAP